MRTLYYFVGDFKVEKKDKHQCPSINSFERKVTIRSSRQPTLEGKSERCGRESRQSKCWREEKLEIS